MKVFENASKKLRPTKAPPEPRGPSAWEKLWPKIREEFKLSKNPSRAEIFAAVGRARELAKLAEAVAKELGVTPDELRQMLQRGTPRDRALVKAAVQAIKNAKAGAKAGLTAYEIAQCKARGIDPRRLAALKGKRR